MRSCALPSVHERMTACVHAHLGPCVHACMRSCALGFTPCALGSAQGSGDPRGATVGDSTTKKGEGHHPYCFVGYKGKWAGRRTLCGPVIWRSRPRTLCSRRHRGQPRMADTASEQAVQVGVLHHSKRCPSKALGYPFILLCVRCTACSAVPVGVPPHCRLWRCPSKALGLLIYTTACYYYWLMLAVAIARSFQTTQIATGCFGPCKERRRRLWGSLSVLA